VKAGRTRSKHIALSLLATIPACGRIGFREPGDAGSAGVDTAPADACTFGPWNTSALQPFGKLNTNLTEWSAQISADGLHLVFSSDRSDPSDPRPGGHLSLFVTQRASRTVEFEAPSYPAELNNPRRSARDPSFTPDLLEIYFVDDTGSETCPFVSRRANTSAAWAAPAMLDKLCRPGGFSLGGVYVSDDGLRLYYDTVVSGDPSAVWMTSRASRGVDFNLPGAPIPELPRGLGYCALTADELTIACEAGPPLTTRTELWQATRRSRDEPFGTAGAIPELEGMAQDGDPSFTADGTQLVYASDIGGDNDLYVAERACR
jgi:hypothetical protein